MFMITLIEKGEREGEVCLSIVGYKSLSNCSLLLDYDSGLAEKREYPNKQKYDECQKNRRPTHHQKSFPASVLPFNLLTWCSLCCHHCREVPARQLASVESIFKAPVKEKQDTSPPSK